MEMRKSVVIASLLVGSTASVFAATDPQEINWGGGKIIPTIKVSAKYDDNIFNDDNNEVDSLITQFEPGVDFIVQKNANIYKFGYIGDYSYYSDSSDDDYGDHKIAADLHFDMGSKARLDFLSGYGWLHDDRGTGASEGIGFIRPEPDEYDQLDVAGSLELGAESGRFNLSLDASIADIEYQNNREQTKFRDRQDARRAATLFMRIAPKTSLLLEGSFMELEYDLLGSANGASLDSEETAFLVGMTWDITGKTTGSAKVGAVDKEFDEAAQGSDDMVTWDIDLSWSPRTYSTVFFSSSSLPSETNGTGLFIESALTSVHWVHDWSERLHTQASASIGTDEFNQDPREDDINRYGVSANYDFNRWMNIGIGYSFDEKDSNVDLFDYSRNIYSISFDISL
jgi:hypothetical protein